MPVADYPVIADNSSITDTQVNNYFANKLQSPTSPVEPTITQAKIVAIANALYTDGIQAHRGIRGLAIAVRLTTKQVKDIILALKSLEAEWEAAQG